MFTVFDLEELLLQGNILTIYSVSFFFTFVNQFKYEYSTYNPPVIMTSYLYSKYSTLKSSYLTDFGNILLAVFESFKNYTVCFMFVILLKTC